MRAAARAGDITISTRELQLVKGGIIDASTFGKGNGGAVTISAAAIFVDRQDSQYFTGISTQTELVEGGGKGGDIIITTADLQVANGGQISGSTLGSGEGGTLAIWAESILVNGQNSPFVTGIEAQTHSETGGGKGGDITIDTTEFTAN